MRVVIVLALTLMGAKVSTAAGHVCTTDEAEIIFLLDWDSRLSIPYQHHFAANVSAAFKVGPDNARFGTVIAKFYQCHYVQYYYIYGIKCGNDLDIYREVLSKEFDDYIYDYGAPPPTDFGLKGASEMKSNYSSPTAAKVVIVITDSESFHPNLFTGGNLHPPCPNGEVVGSQCLTLSSQKMTKADATQSCTAKNGGKIFEIKSEELYIQLGDIAKENGLKLWAGAKEVAEGDWRWLSDNSSANISENWFKFGEPNNWRGNEECLQMRPDGKLNDAHCDKRFHFVCVNQRCSF